MPRKRSITTVSALPEKQVDLEGFLIKRGGFVKNWKTRWFDIKDGIVRYYYSFEQNTKPIKSLYLGATTSCEVCSTNNMPKTAPTPFCFLLKFDHKKRTYYCCASSNEEMHVWVAKIQQYIDSITNSAVNEEWAMEHAKAVDHSRSSVGALGSDVDGESEEDTSEDVFQTHQMRLSQAPWKA